MAKNKKTQASSIETPEENEEVESTPASQAEGLHGLQLVVDRNLLKKEVGVEPETEGAAATYEGSETLEQAPEFWKSRLENLKGVVILEVVPALARKGVEKEKLERLGEDLSRLTEMIEAHPNLELGTNSQLRLVELSRMADGSDQSSLSQEVRKQWDDWVRESLATTTVALGKESFWQQTKKASKATVKFVQKSFEKHPFWTSLAVTCGVVGTYKLLRYMFKPSEGKPSWWRRALPWAMGGGALYVVGKYFGPEISKYIKGAMSLKEKKELVDKMQERVKAGDVLGAVESAMELGGKPPESLAPDARQVSASRWLNEIVGKSEKEGFRQTISPNALATYRKLSLGNVSSALSKIADVAVLRERLNFEDTPYTLAFVKSIKSHPEYELEIQSLYHLIYAVNARGILDEPISDSMSIDEAVTRLNENRAIIEENFSAKPLGADEGFTVAERAGEVVEATSERVEQSTKELVSDLLQGYGTLINKERKKTLSSIVEEIESKLASPELHIWERASLRYDEAKAITDTLSDNGMNVVLKGGEILFLSGGKITIKRSAAALTSAFWALAYDQDPGKAVTCYLTEASPLIVFGVVGGGAWGALKSIGGVGAGKGALQGAFSGGLKMAVLPLKLGKMAAVDIPYTVKHLKEWSQIHWEEVRLAKEWAKKAAWGKVLFVDALKLEENYEAKRLLLLRRKLDFVKTMKATKIKTPFIEARALEMEMENLSLKIGRLETTLKGDVSTAVRTLSETVPDFSLARKVVDRPQLLKVLAEDADLLKKFIDHPELMSDEFMERVDRAIGESETLTNEEKAMIRAAKKINREMTKNGIIQRKMKGILQKEIEGYKPSEKVRLAIGGAEAAEPTLAIEKPAEIGPGKFRYFSEEFSFREDEIQSEAQRLGGDREKAVQKLCRKAWANPRNIEETPAGRTYRYRGMEVTLSKEEFSGKNNAEIAKLCDTKFLERVQITDVRDVGGVAQIKVGEKWVEVAEGEANAATLKKEYLERLKESGVPLEGKPLGNPKLLKYLPVLKETLGPAMAAYFIYQLETAQDKRKAVAESAVGLGTFMGGMKMAEKATRAWTPKSVVGMLGKGGIVLMGGLATAIGISEPIESIVEALWPHFVGEQQMASEIISIFEKQSGRSLMRTVFASAERGVIKGAVEKLGMQRLGALLTKKVESTAVKKIAEFVAKPMIRKLAVSLGLKGVVTAGLIADDVGVITILDDVIAAGLIVWMAKDIYDVVVIADKALKVKVGMEQRSKLDIANVEPASEIDRKALEAKLEVMGKPLEELEDGELMEVLQSLPQIKVRITREGLGGYEEYQFVKGEVWSMKIANPDGSTYTELKTEELNKKIAIEPPEEFRPLEIDPTLPKEKLLPLFRLAILQIKSECGWTSFDHEIVDEKTILLKRLDGPEALTMNLEDNGQWSLPDIKSGLTFQQAIVLGNLVNMVKGLVKKEDMQGANPHPFELDGLNIDFDKDWSPIDTRILSAETRWLEFYQKIGLDPQTIVDALNRWYAVEHVAA